MEQTTGPITVFVLSTRKQGTTFTEYKNYYEGNHVPLVTNLVLQGDLTPQLWIRNYIERDIAAGAEAAPSFPFGGVETWDYDCITTVVFRDKQHRDNVFAKFGEHREEIAADEAKFLDTSKMKIIFTTDNQVGVRERS